MIILGVDPGLKGAAVSLEVFPDKSLYIRKVLKFADYVGTGLNYLELARLYDRWPNSNLAVIEDVSVQTGAEGRVSMFKFGYVKGVVSAYAAAHSVEVVYLKPAVWKLSLGLSSDKEKSLTLARKIFPMDQELFRYKKDVDVAEAALLAYCGTRL